MENERWRRIEEVFHSASERNAEERGAFLAGACAGDDDLRREVESLLAQQSKDTPLDRPASEMAAGSRLGPYELLEPIGSGGMGTVFKARDTRLNRSVAIKISSSQFSGRFATEARAIAALNHPHICTLHDVGPNYLVMEFVEGENLAQRLQKGALPLDRALRYALEIADAVAAAHARGIVHRDLKPANIMVDQHGTLKVLDFGLAKLTEQPASENTPTEALHAQTESGIIVGTAAYMSPEQAEGKPVDGRSDIFSFGAVLYEMLTGQRAFQGDSQMSTLSAVLNKEPSPLSDEVPQDLQKLITRCLRKDRARRYQHMDELKVALEELKEESEPGRLAGVPAAKPSRRWLWLAAAATVLLLAAVLIWRVREASHPVDLRAVALTSFPGIEAGPSFSPDGNKVTFLWNGDKEDNVDIYVKQIGSAGPPMRLTTDPAPEFQPAWSPDDRWIAFVRRKDGKDAIILKPPYAGAPERKLAEAKVILTPSWSPDGKWLTVSEQDSETRMNIWAISVDTNEPRRRLTTFVTKGMSSTGPPLGDYYPSISPDGLSLAFSRQVVSYVWEVYVQRLTPDLQPAGEPVKLTDQRYGTIYGVAWTANGRELIYSAGGVGSQSLWRVSVSGRQKPQRLPFVNPAATVPTIARTLPRLVYTHQVNNLNIWRMDTRTLERKRLIGSTYSAGGGQYSPDGRRIALYSNRSGETEVWACDADGTNCQQLTSFGGPVCGSPTWSPDGRWLALDSRSEGWSEIYVIPADGGPPRRVTFSPGFSSTRPTWSRDGRWIYFTSDRSGRNEIWKVPVAGGQLVQVTRLGGAAALESLDGRHIYYTKEPDPPGLFRMPAEGGDERQVVPGNIAWAGFTVAAKGVYFSTDGKAIQLLDTTTGKVSTLTTLRAPDYFYPGSVSPDGTYLLSIHQDQLTSDLMLVENFR